MQRGDKDKFRIVFIPGMVSRSFKYIGGVLLLSLGSEYKNGCFLFVRQIIILM